ncbi:MAG: hypothetical protein JW822_08955 [Spirochaetales bacterium]|nr:hypothetical protein [Spirochaetales bacterium]
MSLTTKKEIPSGSDVEIEFLQPDTHSSIVLSGKVIRTNYIEEHKCYFTEITLTIPDGQTAEILNRLNDKDMFITRNT